MSDNNRFGDETGRNTTPLSSQTGSDTNGRSPEYSDNLTSEQAPAGSASPEQASSWNDTATGIQSPSIGSDRGTGFGAGTEAGSVSGNSSGGMSGGYTGTGGTSATGGSTFGGGSDDDRSGQPSGYGSGSRELGDNTDGLGRDQTDQVTADETGTLISADKVQGTAVYDASGERLGTIDSLMLNKRSGKVAYAVMSFGGFLGIGERYHPLPWDKLTYDTEKGGYNVGSTQDELRAGPTYSRDELDSFGDNGRRSEVDDYYRGMPSALEGGLTRSGGIPQV